MTDRYTPAVGDRIRLPLWSEHEWAEVTATGRCWLLAVDQDGIEDSWRVDRSDWIKVERPTPIPHRYIGLWPEGPGFNVWSSPEQMSPAGGPESVLHIWTDEDGVDRIERVKP